MEQQSTDSQSNLKTSGTPARRTSHRGFASMDPARQRQIASEGGRAAHAQGTAHEFNSKEAAEAGRLGGMARGLNRAKRLAEQRAAMNAQSTPTTNH